MYMHFSFATLPKKKLKHHDIFTSQILSKHLRKSAFSYCVTMISLCYTEENALFCNVI